MDLIKRIKSYAIANPVGYLVSGLGAYQVIQNMSHWSNGQFDLKGDLTDILILTLGLLTSYKTLSTYRRVRNHFEENGYDERFAKPKLYSWCDRNAVQTAAYETDHLSEFFDQCDREGHEFFHFLPKQHRFNEVQH